MTDISNCIISFDRHIVVVVSVNVIVMKPTLVLLLVATAIVGALATGYDDKKDDKDASRTDLKEGGYGGYGYGGYGYGGPYYGGYGGYGYGRGYGGYGYDGYGYGGYGDYGYGRGYGGYGDYYGGYGHGYGGYGGYGRGYGYGY